MYIALCIRFTISNIKYGATHYVSSLSLGQYDIIYNLFCCYRMA